MGDNKDSLWAQTGAAAAGTAANNTIGAIFGLAMEKHNDKRQLRQQEKLNALQMKGSKEMMDYQMMKELEMWKNTGYEAQMKQMKEAGLNPGLMYGMGGGGGGSTGNASASIQGAGAPQGGREIIDMQGKMMEQQMMKAQIQLAESQANKNNVEAAKTAGVDTDEAKYRIGVMDQILVKGQDELRILANEANISDNTWKARVDQVLADAIGAELRNQQTKAETGNKLKDTELKQSQILEIAQRIQQEWAKIDQKDTELAIQKFRAEIEANYPGVSGVLGKIADDAISTFFKATKVKRPQFKKIENK